MAAADSATSSVTVSPVRRSPDHKDAAYPLFPALEPSFVGNETILSEELAKAEEEGGSELSPRSVGVGMTVAWEKGATTTTTTSSSTTRIVQQERRVYQQQRRSESPPAAPAGPPATKLTENLEHELEERRRRLREKQREEEEQRRSGEGGGLLADLARLKRRFGGAGDIGDEDFEEMADTIKSILSGRAERREEASAPSSSTAGMGMPSRTVPPSAPRPSPAQMPQQQVQKPPRKNKTPEKHDKTAGEPKEDNVNAKR